ncbi:transposase [uncultured Nitrosomonas sp.]|uniref:transposase n=1 Tax=uncultured Nitrosomonas sp. TaxID=156424 RepID=UPI0025FEA4AD|nr:transposase [uncultured Nitrosomonas sp.]
MSFSKFDVTRRTRKGNFLNQIDYLIDWEPIEKAIAEHYAPTYDAAGCPAYPGLLLFKMLLARIWHGGLSDDPLKTWLTRMYVMRFLSLNLEHDVPDHSVLSRFRTRLPQAHAWDDLLKKINQQIQGHDIMVTQGCHVDASITHSPRKPKTRPLYEMVADRENRDDEAEAKAAMRVIEVAQPGVDAEARWVKKNGKSVFGYKQHTLVDNNGLV